MLTSWGQRSNFFNFKTLGPFQTKVGRRMKLDQRSDHMGSGRSKVKVTGVKSPISISSRHLGRIWPKLEEVWSLTRGVTTWGILGQKSRSLGSKVKFLYLQDPWADPDQTYWDYEVWPEKWPHGFIKVKGQGHWGQRSILYTSTTLGPILTKLGWSMKHDQKSDPMRSSRSKVKVTEVKGQLLISLRPLGRSWPNLVEVWSMTREVTPWGHQGQRSRSLRSNVNIVYL